MRSQNGNGDAKLHQYDIVRKEQNHYAVWLESAPTFGAAESRIEELTTVWPGGNSRSSTNNRTKW